ncbi:hypothetical protein E5329_21430 [Petralouisia muris]|uniref:Uncharacterized protein n=1 Tax=Petralouisia muris TaxID=3032872 RepID=A0AC61RS21_9FIRM|nr:hypothetical protein [Petralouisia muris]TGY91356.1 hypothetical protein E5329_21430 [Petralouisia muris]
MNLGVTGKLGGYYLAEQYRKNAAADKNGGVSFAELAAAKAAGQPKVPGMSFKDMWQARFPGAYYHVMDGSAISQGAWDRNDFPFERFFSDHVDESILNWTPSGAEPPAGNSEVQSRWSSMAGKKAVIVPPALDEKMKNNPELAKRVMADVENFIATYPATPGCSYLIEVDENGGISKYRVTSPGQITVSSSEFVDARRAREAKHAEYERLAEEAALKRKLMEQETDERYYQTSITKKAVSIAAYEAAGILK